MHKVTPGCLLGKYSQWTQKITSGFWGLNLAGHVQGKTNTCYTIVLVPRLIFGKVISYDNIFSQRIKVN